MWQSKYRTRIIFERITRIKITFTWKQKAIFKIIYKFCLPIFFNTYRVTEHAMWWFLKYFAFFCTNRTFLFLLNETRYLLPKTHWIQQRIVSCPEGYFCTKKKYCVIFQLGNSLCFEPKERKKLKREEWQNISSVVKCSLIFIELSFPANKSKRTVSNNHNSIWYIDTAYCVRTSICLRVRVFQREKKEGRCQATVSQKGEQILWNRRYSVNVPH